MLNTASHVLCTVAYLMKAPYSKPLFLKVSRVLEREGDEARGSEDWKNINEPLYIVSDSSNVHSLALSLK